MARRRDWDDPREVAIRNQRYRIEDDIQQTPWEQLRERNYRKYSRQYELGEISYTKFAERIRSTDRTFRNRERREQYARVLGLRTSGKASYHQAILVYQHNKHRKWSYTKIRADPYFKYWYGILREEENKILDGKPVSRSYRSLYALALNKLGYRHGTHSAVGDTPKLAFAPEGAAA